MKSVLFTVLEAGSSVDELLAILHQNGFNGTYLPSASFNSLVGNLNEEEPAVISLGRALQGTKKENPAFFSIVNDETFPALRKIIEDYTENFKKIKGAMFMWPLSFFEGSFH